MADYNQEQAKNYKTLNKAASEHGVVIFGSSYLHSFPFYDLMQGRVFDYAVYNRSIEGLTVSEAITVLDDCVNGLFPDTILVSFGENEPTNEKFFADYDNLIKKIKMTCPACKICILPAHGKDKEYTLKLKALAEANSTEFIPLQEGASDESLFKRMSGFFRNGKISFADAFCI